MERHEVLVIGGGNAWISLAARLLRDGVGDVAVVESHSTHRYRPLLSYVGGGEATMASLERPAASVVPPGCTSIRGDVVSVDPTGPRVELRDGRSIAAASLVVCPGLEEDWEATPGLADAYRQGWAGSTYVVDTAPLVWPALRDLTRGRVVFTMPPEPAPCAATALKPLFMACDHWRRTGVLGDIDVHLALPRTSPIGVPRADARIEAALQSYGVRVLREARVLGIAHHRITLSIPGKEVELDDVTFAHVVPHYRAPAWIGASDLAGSDAAGLVDVDPFTLHHRRHPAVWALGDAAAADTRPSGGALRRQVAVLAHNMRASDPSGYRRYDGYTVMPITLGRHTLMLVEVDRDGNLQPSLPLVDLLRPRRTTWFVDRYVLPQVYFRRLLRGKV